MSTKSFSRREFIKKKSLTGMGVLFASSAGSSLYATGAHLSLKTGNINVPALLGGTPVHTGGWPKWPAWNPATDEKRVLESLSSGVWSRAKIVSEFEQKWAQMMGAKRCLAVVNGTNALIAALTQAGIGGGDEVITTPYTFIASTQAIVMTGAMPVFADVDPETFQIDPKNIEKKITPRTRAIMPVHILGLPCDMVAIMAIAQKHNLVVIEDACQAWMAEINHKKIGTFGLAGCYSFQTSKNITMGEGGAIVSDNDEFMDRCHSFHNYGNPYGSARSDIAAGAVMLGTKMRLAEYQAAIALAQLVRLEDETTIRNENAAYLRAKIEKIPGIVPYKLYDNVTRAAFHFYPFRYKKEQFKGLPRTTFIRALIAEGVPCWTGYANLNKMPYIDHVFQTKNFQKMYPKELLDIDRYRAANQCPENDRLCEEEAVWLNQYQLLGKKSDMDDIAAAIEKIQKNAEQLLSWNR